MVFISWWKRPTPDVQRACLENSKALNYDPEFNKLTSNAPFSEEDRHHLAKAGYTINFCRARLGSGSSTFQKAKNLLHQWRHFQLNWAWVDSKTCIRPGERFCVCTRELMWWVAMPLEVLFVNDKKIAPSSSSSSLNPPNLKDFYQFGSGTLRGHLLAGEERFSVELDDNDDVWYEVLSFSRPAHHLSFIARPYILLKQKLFAEQSKGALLKSLLE